MILEISSENNFKNDKFSKYLLFQTKHRLSITFDGKEVELLISEEIAFCSGKYSDALFFFFK